MFRRSAIDAIEEQVLWNLPMIHGSWFFVDASTGSDTGRNGRTPNTALATLSAAYAKCTSGRGDGICIFSRSIASYSKSIEETAVIDWAKYGITVIGISAGNGYFGRVRIYADSDADLAYMINVSGQNNRFINLHINNEGDANTCLRCVIVSGNRNYFENCHFIGGSHATPGAVAACSSLDLRASENRFVKCWFGTNSTVQAQANAPVTFSTTQQGQNFFEDCYIITKSSTAGHGGINIIGAATMNGWTIFKNCIFTAFSATGGGSPALTKVVIGDAQNDCGILLHNCTEVGWSAWSTLASKAYVGCAGETAAGAGGIASVPAA